MDYRNPNDVYQLPDHDPYKGMDEVDRQALVIKRALKILLVFVVTLLVLYLFSGCTTPMAVEEHHHHHYEADTLAVKAQVDRHLQSWHEQMQAVVSVAVSQQLSLQSQSEHQQETVTETITETFDSLGRKLRQEQRTISRDISRELQTITQQLSRTYELRLHHTVDSIDSVWQQRYDAIQTHWEQTDSALLQKTPVAQDSRPWYKKLWDRLQFIVLGAVLAVMAWFAIRRK